MADWESKDVKLPPQSMWRYAQAAPKLTSATAQSAPKLTPATPGGSTSVDKKAASAKIAASPITKAASSSGGAVNNAGTKPVGQPVKPPPVKLQRHEPWKDEPVKLQRHEPWKDEPVKLQRHEPWKEKQNLKGNDSWKSTESWKGTESWKDKKDLWKDSDASKWSQQGSSEPSGAAASTLTKTVASNQTSLPKLLPKIEIGEQKDRLPEQKERLPLVVIRSSLPNLQPRLTGNQFGQSGQMSAGGINAPPPIQYSVYIDELEMPERPDVDPSPTDREVFVDPLPDNDDLTNWLKAFGDVEDVFRLPDPETGAPTERGYVQFKRHETAKKCVESGAARWSESERALASQTSVRRFAVRCYPESVVSAFLGKRGEDIGNLRKACGVWKLAVKGADLAPKKGVDEGAVGVESARLHFWAEGSDDAIERVRTALENRLAEIHRDVKKTLEKLGDTWQAEQKDLMTKRRNKRRRMRDGEHRQSKRRPRNDRSYSEVELECEDDEISQEEPRETDEASDWYNMPARSRATYGRSTRQSGRHRRRRAETPPEFGVGPSGGSNSGGSFEPGESSYDGGYYRMQTTAIGQIPPPHGSPHNGAPPPGWSGWTSPSVWQPPPPSGPPVGAVGAASSGWDDAREDDNDKS